MKNNLQCQLKCVVLGAMILPVAAMAQFEGKTCTPIPSTTTAIPAPGSGTVTVGPLTKYGLAAMACGTVGNFSQAGVSYEYTTTLATSFNNATFPSSCAGVPYTLHGGPTYSAMTGSGSLAFSGSSFTGTVNAIAFTQTDNLTLTAAGSSFVINTGLIAYQTSVTLNADQSIDIRVCTPAGGVPATVNGSSFTIPNNIWQCLAAPTEPQPNVRVTFVEGC